MRTGWARLATILGAAVLLCTTAAWAKDEKAPRPAERSSAQPAPKPAVPKRNPGVAMPKTVPVATSRPANLNPNQRLRVERPPVAASDPGFRDALVHAQAERWTEARERARAAGGEVGERVIQWIYLKRRGSMAPFAEIASFIESAPDWPEMGRMLRDAEQAMPDGFPPEAALKWFSANAPETGAGRLHLIETLYALGRSEDAARALHRLWASDSLDVGQERAILARYGHLLGEDDHRARVDALLWRRQTASAQRNLRLVDPEFRAVAEARIRLIADQGGVDAALARAGAAAANNPGLIYDRVVWNRKRGRNDEASRLLLGVPRDPDNAERWWSERQALSRTMLREGDARLAYQLAARHGQAPGDGVPYTEAEWMAGWIALRYLEDPVQAYRHFQAVYDAGRTPITRARGAYWAGRAAEANRKEVGAENWYVRAAVHPATYYGQLAAARLGLRDLQLPPAPAEQPYSAVMALHPLVAAVRLLAATGSTGRGFVDPFVLRLADLSLSEEEFAFVAALAHESGRPELGLRVAKKATRKGHLLLQYAFPTGAFPVVGDGIGEPERALVLALTRQESEFDAAAVSPAGALGLMQLMPGTANEVARKLGISVKPADLINDPRLNVRLGSSYIASLLESFDNFYPLALAAYNAGPGRARQWMRENGDPRQEAVDPVDWIEQIPFSETRNYVQRVLESLNVYRHRLDAHEARIVVPDRFTR